MKTNMRETLSDMWRYCRIPVLLGLTIVAAFLAAYAASRITGLVYERIISAYHWLEKILGQTSDVADLVPTRGKLFAGLAIGAAVVVTWFKEVIEKVGDLWPWQDAEEKAIRPALVAIFASGLGLFISAFAVENTTSESREFSLAFDGIVEDRRKLTRHFHHRLLHP